MDGIFALIPIMVLAVAVAAIVSTSVLKFQRLRLEEARLRAGDSDDTGDLAREVAELQRELIEVHERLDFAERMIAQVRERPGLAAPPPSQST